MFLRDIWRDVCLGAAWGFAAILLALTEKDSASVRVWNLDEKKQVASLESGAKSPYLYASPGGRYTLLLQADRVQILDGGLWQEDHGDHLHDYRKPPRLLGAEIKGSNPGHFQDYAGVGALFMEGDKNTDVPARVYRVTDESLGGSTLASSFEAGPSVHGVAEPRGNFMLVAARTDDAPTALPNKVDLYRLNAHKQWAKVQRLDGDCPGLHGSASNASYSAFGCTDGVLVVHQQGEQFSTKKIDNPAGLPDKVRVGNLRGHAKVAQFIGLARGGRIFNIDPAAGTMQAVNWTSASDPAFRSVTFSRTGSRLLVLDGQGMAHWLDSTQQWKVAGSAAAIANMPTQRPYPWTVSSGARDEFFITDPLGKQVVVLDGEQPRVKDRVALDFAPVDMAWMGIRTP